MSTRFIQGSPANYQGRVDGAAIPAGYVGEAIGTLRSGTNGASYSGRSSTAPTNTMAALASQTINKGVYLVSATSWVINPDATIRQYELELRVGGTAITSTIYVNGAQGNPVTLSIPAVPVVISADNTSVAVFGRLNGLAGSVGSTGHEIWITRIA